MSEQNMMEPEPQTETEAPAPDVAEIHRAFDYGEYLVLLLIIPGETTQTAYVLYPHDPYGLAPGLRAQMERMVADGDITIEPAPPQMEPLPV